MQNIAIIGAGLAGAILSSRLTEAGLNVTVFEKSRGTGGRLASARLDDLSADLGAPSIDAYAEPFKCWLALQQQQGRVQELQPRTVDFSGKPVESQPVWLGKGRNSSLTRELIGAAKLITQTRIGVIWPDREGVLLRDEAGASLGYFDAAICTAPAPQAVALLEAVPRFAALADEAVTDPSWVYAAVLEQLPQRLVGVDLVETGHPQIARIIVDSNKPGRSGLVIKVEMGRDWSEANRDVPADRVKAQLVNILESWLQESLLVKTERIHRWLYNCSHQPSPGAPSLWDSDTHIGACGAWVSGAGLQGSFLSAQHLADELLKANENAA